jgi:hypothetical protein
LKPPRLEYTEAQLQAGLIAMLRATPGLRAWRQQCGKVRVRGGFMQLAPTGAGDICGTAAPDGLHYEVEVKGHKTAVQDGQDPWAAETVASGGVYLRARPRGGESLPDAVRRCVAELLEAIAEARSRRGCSEAEVAIAEQVARGGDAGDSVELDAAETLAAASRLLEAVDGAKARRRRVA